MGSLKNKKVLITSGPTWVAIDKVRVISNIATGETGLLLAHKLAKAGAKVTLLINSADTCCTGKKIKIIEFRFFEELRSRMLKELRRAKYDALVHCAAVSDYKPEKVAAGKIGSAKPVVHLTLVPTVKIIETVKKISPRIFLVGFKFLPDAHKQKLVCAARQLMQRAKADLVVANTLIKNQYVAHILSRTAILGPFKSKDVLSGQLLMALKGIL